MVSETLYLIQYYGGVPARELDAKAGVTTLIVIEGVTSTSQRKVVLKRAHKRGVRAELRGFSGGRIMMVVRTKEASSAIAEALEGLKVGKKALGVLEYESRLVVMAAE